MAGWGTPGNKRGHGEAFFCGPDGMQFVKYDNSENVQIGQRNEQRVVGPPRRRSRHEATKELTTSTAELTLAQRELVSKKIKKKWKKLGKQLGLPEADLYSVEYDRKCDEEREKAYCMIRKWEETSAPAKVCVLAKALDDIGRGDIADLLS